MDANHALQNGAAPTQSTTCEGVQSISPPPLPPPPPPVSTIHGKLPSSPGKYAYALSTASVTWMSVVIVIAGALSIVAAELALGYYALYAEVGAGIWCGLAFVAAGAVGISAGQHKTDTLIKATVVGSVLAILFSAVQLTLHCLGLKRSYTCSFVCVSEYWDECKCASEDWESIATTASALLVASAGTVMLLSGWLLLVVCLSVRSSSASSSSPSQIVTYQVQRQTPTTANHQVHQPSDTFNHQTPTPVHSITLYHRGPDVYKTGEDEKDTALQM